MGVRGLSCVRTEASIVVKRVELVPISEWPCSLFTPGLEEKFQLVWTETRVLL